MFFHDDAVVENCDRVHAIAGKPKRANTVLQVLIDLSNTELAEAQDVDLNLRLIKDILSANPS